MRNLILSALLGLVASFAHISPSRAQSATQEVTYVVCKQGAGCRCTLTGMNATIAALILNSQDPPENADRLILLSDEADTRWSPLSPNAADAAYGGDGICPIEVFALPTPEDGRWLGKVRTTSITGCAPQVAEIVPSVVSTLEFDRSIAWEGKFHPAKLSTDPDSALVSWTEINPVLYSGTLNSPVKSDVLQVTGTLSARLTAPGAAVATLQLRIGASGVNADILASIGMADCRTTAVYDFNKVE